MTRPIHRGKLLVGTTLLAAALFSGCGNSENFVFTNTNNPVNPVNPVQAPVAQDDAFNALGDATLNQAASGVLANDTLNGGEISAFDTTGSQGGSIVLSADGSFTYTPATGFVGAETFTYTLTNAGGDSTATVTLNSTGLGRFVDNTAGPGGTGTQANPFNTLADALNAAQSGDTIFVTSGDGTTTGLTGPIVLPQGVDLIGQGTGLVLGQTIEPAGNAPVLQGPIRPEGDNLIQGLTVDGSADFNLFQIEDVSDVTVNECTLMNPDDGDHIVMDNVGGTISVTNCTLQSPFDSGSNYIQLYNEDTDGTILVTDNTFLNAENNDTDKLFNIDCEGTSHLTVDFSRNTADGTESDQFNHAVDFDNRATLHVTCNDNVLNSFEETVLDINKCDSAVISGNTISDVGREEEGHGIFVCGKPQGSSTVTISANMIFDIGDGNGVRFEFDDDGNSTTVLVISNNNLNDTDDGFFFRNEYDGHDVAVALRDNSITDCDESVAVFWRDDEQDVCFEIVGNTVDEDMDFSVTDGQINVEQRDLVQTLNTFLMDAEFDPENETDSVADGACSIP